MTDEPNLDVWLERLGRQRFVLHQFNIEHRDGPDVVAAVHLWGDVADVFVLVDPHHACAFRVPYGHDEHGQPYDLFDPEAVYWWFTAEPAWTIQALLELPQPAHRNAPSMLIRTPRIYRIPKDKRRSVRVTMRWH